MKYVHAVAALVGVAILGASMTALHGQGASPNMAAFQKFRDQHKYTFQLRTMTSGGLMECERVKSTQVKPAQAKKLLAVLTPLRKQPKMTQDQAKAAIKGIQRALEPRQLTAMDKALRTNPRMSSGPRPGGGAGGPGGPGGARPAGANRPRFDVSKMKNFNPFFADKTSPRYKMELDRNNKLFSFLQARAAGKTATLSLRPPGPRR